MNVMVVTRCQKSEPEIVVVYIALHNYTFNILPLIYVPLGFLDRASAQWLPIPLQIKYIKKKLF